MAVVVEAVAEAAGWTDRLVRKQGTACWELHAGSNSGINSKRSGGRNRVRVTIAARKMVTIVVSLKKYSNSNSGNDGTSSNGSNNSGSKSN